MTSSQTSPLAIGVALWPLPFCVVVALALVLGVGDADVMVGCGAALFSFTLYYLAVLALLRAATRWTWRRTIVIATVLPFALALALLPVTIGNSGFFPELPAALYLGYPGLYVADALHHARLPSSTR